VVLGEGGGLGERLVFFLWKHFMEPDTFAGCFTRFYLCHLKKKEMVPRPDAQPRQNRPDRTAGK